MSTEISKEVICPGCGARVAARMWTGINAEVNPNLRAQVLDETLFDWKCPQCGHEATLAYPCLYHDKGRRFMVYVLPQEPDEQKAAGIAAQFPQLRGVRKRVTGSLASLKEKILLFEDGLDDRAVEFVKLLVSLVLERSSGKRVTQGLYVSSDEEHERIGFLFSLEGEEQPVHRVTSFSAYHKASAIVELSAPAGRRRFPFWWTNRLHGACSSATAPAATSGRRSSPRIRRRSRPEGEEQAESTDRKEI